MAYDSPSSQTRSPISPASPSAMVSPLQIRKHIYTANVTRKPTVSSDVSPVTPAKTVPFQPSVTSTPVSRYTSRSRNQQPRQSPKPERPTIVTEPTAKAAIFSDPSIYSGLQVDERQKPLPRPPSEAHQSPKYGPPGTGQFGTSRGMSRANTNGTMGTMSTRDLDNGKISAAEQWSNPQASKTSPKSFWQPRKRLWLLLLIMFGLLVLIGIIVGAVVESQKHSSSNSSAQQQVSNSSMTTTPPLVTPTASPIVYDNQLPASAVHANAPLAAIQFMTNSSDKDSAAGVQNYELYYNTHCGNTAQLQNSGSWSSTNGIIYTDAINGSGIAAITYWNQTLSQHQSYTFYVGVDNLLRDKRHNPNDNTFEIGKLAKQHVAVPAAAVDPSETSDGSNSTASVNNYALGAIYSDYMPGGPGARLFFHGQNSTHNYLQEWIWNLSNDSWTKGTTIDGVLPTSHIAITADEPNAVVRLMFASNAGNADDISAPPQLQEYYLMLNDPSATWTKGQASPNLLLNPSSQFALAAGAGTSYLYHVTPLNSTGPTLQIQELALPNANSTEAIRPETAETVAVPDWASEDTAGRVQTFFAPVGAVAGAGYMNIFFAHGVVDARAGYKRLSYVSRGFGVGWAASTDGSGNGINDLPLNTKCVKPDV